MSENQKKILEMLANKRISVDEAHRLLSALKTEAGAPATSTGRVQQEDPRQNTCVSPYSLGRDTSVMLTWNV
jgi:hypothetical protein